MQPARSHDIFQYAIRLTQVTANAGKWAVFVRSGRPNSPPWKSRLGEVSRTKAVYKRELADFTSALGDGLLHGTDEVFDSLEALDLEDDHLKNDRKWIIDAIILSSVLVKAKRLRENGAKDLYFVSLDKKAFQPTPARPKLTQYYDEAGLTFVLGFVLPPPSASP